MALIVESGAGASGARYEIPNEGPVVATLTEVKDLGIVETRFGPKRRVRFTWETEQVGASGRPLRVFQAFNLSFDPKAHLYKAVRQILGREPERRFDLESLVGTRATLIIEHNEGSEGKVYANVVTVVRPAAGVRP